MRRRSQMPHLRQVAEQKTWIEWGKPRLSLDCSKFPYSYTDFDLYENPYNRFEAFRSHSLCLRTPIIKSNHGPVLWVL